MSHTPGTWEVVSLSGYGAPFSIRMAYHSDNPNAPKTHYGVQSVRTREDAYLIAAAPELLEALKDARDELWRAHQHTMSEHEFHSRYKAIDAAISKATGGSK